MSDSENQLNQVDPPAPATATTEAAAWRRKALGHVAPGSVRDGALYFVTMCCEQRGPNQLCVPSVATQLIDSMRFYHDHHRLFARLFLLMPDHVHALLAFPANESMSEVIRNWKSFTARKAGIKWQRNYFDHRIRDGENWQLKAAYIRDNPVRKHLVANAADWPWVFEP